MERVVACVALVGITSVFSREFTIEILDDSSIRDDLINMPNLHLNHSTGHEDKGRGGIKIAVNVTDTKKKPATPYPPYLKLPPKLPPSDSWELDYGGVPANADPSDEAPVRGSKWGTVKGKPPQRPYWSKPTVKPPLPTPKRGLLSQISKVLGWINHPFRPLPKPQLTTKIPTPGYNYPVERPNSASKETTNWKPPQQANFSTTWQKPPLPTPKRGLLSKVSSVLELLKPPIGLFGKPYINEYRPPFGNNYYSKGMSPTSRETTSSTWQKTLPKESNVLGTLKPSFDTKPQPFMMANRPQSMYAATKIPSSDNEYPVKTKGSVKEIREGRIRPKLTDNETVNFSAYTRNVSHSSIGGMRRPYTILPKEVPAEKMVPLPNNNYSFEMGRPMTKRRKIRPIMQGYEEVDPSATDKSISGFLD